MLPERKNVRPKTGRMDGLAFLGIPEESECLKHLILTNVSLAGLSFQDLLADDERSRFDAFIRASTQTFGERTDSATPLCLRVSLRGSEGIRVAADLYHVPVPGRVCVVSFSVFCELRTEGRIDIEHHRTRKYLESQGTSEMSTVVPVLQVGSTLEDPST